MSSSLLLVSSSIRPQLDVSLVVNPLKETNYEEAFHNLFVYEELSQYVSQVFTRFIQKHFLESTDFADKLDRSRGDPIAFSRMIDRIDALKKYYFFQPSIIHELYRKARDSFNRINPTIRSQLGDLSNKIASGLSWQSNQKEDLLAGPYPVLAEWLAGFTLTRISLELKGKTL